jgi:hypothetical protein
MRQFSEAYRNDTIVSPLVTSLPWTHHLIILSLDQATGRARVTLNMRILLILRYEWRLKGTGKVLIGQLIGSQPGVDFDLWVPYSEMWTLAGIGK